MKRFLTTLFLFLILGFEVTTAQIFVEDSLQIPTPYINNVGNQFGTSVSIDGNYAIIGVPEYNNFAGCAYICYYNGNYWRIQARLNPSDARTNDMFGSQVRLSGNVAVITSLRADGIYFSTGAAYIFEKPAGGWADATELAKVYPTDCDVFDQFGSALGLSGNTIIVGANNQNGEGAAYIFEKPVTGWVDTIQTAKLVASDKETFDYFGFSVDIKDSLIVIGSKGDSDNGTGSGSAYIFMKPQTGWKDTTETAKIKPSDGAANDAFGISVGCENGLVVVGAYQAHAGKGAIYVFKKPVNGWGNNTESAILTASDGLAGDLFGIKVGISQSSILVGAPGRDRFNTNEGLAYLFYKPVSTWINTTESKIIINKTPTAGEYFGKSVAISNGKLAIGAPSHTNGTYSGATYFYHIAPCDTVYSDEYKSICQGENYLGWTIDGIYNRTFNRANGCDSIVRTHLNIIDDPVLTCPVNITVQCHTNIPLPYASYNAFIVAGGSVQTNGSINISSFRYVSQISDNQTCPETITRVYEITDTCGNTATCSQNIVIHDTTPPTASNPAPVSVQCRANIPAVNVLVVTNEADNCDANPTVTFYNDFSNGNTCPEVIIRTYKITDACGNSTYVTQTITVHDTQKPTANQPAPIHVSCTKNIPAPNSSIITGVTDNCTANPTVTWINDISNNQSCPEIISRYYKVSDACGNYITLTQQIVVHDEEPPTASNPAPIYIQCGESVPAPNINVVTNEADNCSTNPIVIFIRDEPVNNDCPKTINRIYHVYDNCVNWIVLTQQIIYQDLVAPTANNLPDLGPVHCSEIPAPDISIVTGETDNCGGAVTVGYVGDTPAPGCSGIVTRTYSLTDICGNISTKNQNIIIDDDTAPVADTLPNIGPFNCYSEIPPPNINDVKGETDNCSESVTVAFVGDSPNPGCLGTVTRTYSLTDVCGNISYLAQKIMIKDTVPPTATPLFPIGPYECYSKIPAPDINYVTGESDNCGGAVTVAYIGDSGNPGCSGVVIRTYSLTDKCGNTSRMSRNILIEDTTPPTANSLPDLGPYSCYDKIPAPDVNVVTGETDNCGGTVTVAFAGDSNDPGCSGTVTRLYSLSDGCGNLKTISQKITISDIIAPTISCPPNITVQTKNQVPLQYINYSAFTAAGGLATDNCKIDQSSFQMLTETSNGNISPEIITRTYRISDLCGNTKICNQTITVEYSNDVAISGQPKNFNCLNNVVAPYYNLTEFISDGGTVSASCGIKSNSFTLLSGSSNGNTCPEIITRVYQISDSCSNTASFAQIITIDDLEPPVIACPAKLVVLQGNNVPLPHSGYSAFLTAGGSITDNCKIDTTTFGLENETVVSPTIITRRYRVADKCGNFSSCTQEITLSNYSMSCPPAIAVECKALMPAAYTNLSSFINAGGKVASTCAINSSTFKLDTTVSDNKKCPETILRTYQVRDSCNNILMCSQTITIKDNTLPQLLCRPYIFVNVGNPIPSVYANYSAFSLDGGIASDNCGLEITSFKLLSEESDDNLFPETKIRTYQIADKCGNSVSCGQTIEVMHDAEMVFTCPGNLLSVCNSAMPKAYSNVDEFISAGGIASSKCGINKSSFKLINQTAAKGTCPDTISRTYEIYDSCLNMSTCSQKIFILKEADTNPPKLIDFKLAPLEINVSTEAKKVTFSYLVSDDISGLKKVLIKLISPSGIFEINISTFNLILGDSLIGNYNSEIMIPKNSETGLWKINRVELTDASNNTKTYDTAGLNSLNFTTSIKIINCNNPIKNEFVTICNGENYLGLTETGQYYRHFLDMFGCDSTILTSLVVNQLPVLPIITVKADTLTVPDIYSSHKWYIDGIPIVAATSKKLIISKSGFYHVEVTNNFGCKSVSNSVQVFLSSTFDLINKKFDFTIFPNPNNGIFTLAIESEKTVNLNCSIINNLGSTIFSKELLNVGNNYLEKIEPGNIANGIYYLRIINNDKVFMKKFVVR